MPTTAWGPAPTSGMLKTNILRYGSAPRCSVQSTLVDQQLVGRQEINNYDN